MIVQLVASLDLIFLLWNILLGIWLYICLLPPTNWQIIDQICENWFQRNTHRLVLLLLLLVFSNCFHTLGPVSSLKSFFDILGQVFLIRHAFHCRQNLYWNCCKWWIFGELGNHSRISKKDQDRHFSEHFCTPGFFHTRKRSSSDILPDKSLFIAMLYL